MIRMPPYLDDFTGTYARTTHGRLACLRALPWLRHWQTSMVITQRRWMNELD